MDAADCFAAMLRHHQEARRQRYQHRHDYIAFSQDASVNESFNKQEYLAALVSGDSIARQFAKTAAHRLQQHELVALINFFHTGHHHLSAKSERAADLPKRLERFCDVETALSHQDRARLARPSGSENAELGLILHVQSRDGDASAFWDLDSATIQLLQGKGLRSNMLFGYDWHWRAEVAADRRKPQCPTTNWPKGLRQLHDEFSTSLARDIPLPFLLVGGSCTTRSYAKSIGSSAKLIELTIAPPDGKVVVWLEFSTGGQSLKRFTLFMNHPASMFYAQTKVLRQSTVCLDAGLNLVLWLLGISHDAVYFLKQGSICHYTRWGPHGIERGLKGAPLAELHAYRRRESKESTHLDLGDYSEAFLTWAQAYLGEHPASILEQNMSLVATIQSRISAKISESNRRRNLDKTDPQMLRESPVHSAVQQPTMDRLAITDERGHKALATINSPISPSAGIGFTTEQIEKALIWLSERPEITEGESNTVAPFTHLSPHELLSMEYELAVAEVLYMRRFHGLNKTITSKEREKTVANMKNSLRVKSHSIRKRYKVSTRPRRAKKPHVSQGTYIQTGDTEGQARVKRNERPQGVLKRLGGASKAAAPMRSLREWRMALLNGDSFRCYTTHSRLRIRLPFTLTAKVPPDADPERVFLQCHLTEAGSEHENYFALYTTSGDRARRLGIHIQYSVRNSVPSEIRSSWVTNSGMETAKNTRALVDLLDNEESGCHDTSHLRLVNAKPDDSMDAASSCSGLQNNEPVELMSGSSHSQGGYILEANYHHVQGMPARTMSVRPQDLHTRRGRHFAKPDQIEIIRGKSTGR